MRLISLISLAAALAACSSTYSQKSVLEPMTKLMRGKSVAIATPINGSYENKEYPSSGKMTALAVRAAFAPFTNTTTIIGDCSQLACLQGLSTPAHDYYVVPEILHWEDRATEWSGIPDKIEVKVSVYEGPTFKELATTIIAGKSKWATFGGDHPQDLLPEPLNNYVQSLY